MAFELQAVPAVRALAWAAMLAVGAWVVVRRPDAAGRAFAFWTLVWAGGIQVVLSLFPMATDAPTQQVLFRAAYYATLFSSAAFLALLAYAPLRARRAGRWAAVLLGLPALAGLAFAADHGAFLAEAVVGGRYVPAQGPAMAWLYHLVLWTGFTAGMLWLGWRAPTMEPRPRLAATWVMAGLGLFAADRAARTWTWWVRDQGSLPGGPEGLVYGAFMLLFAFGAAWMAWRARPLREGADVGRAVLAGAAVGATALVTYGAAGPADPTMVGVLLSALLAPVYATLVGYGVLLAPAEAPLDARSGRAAVLAEA